MADDPSTAFLKWAYGDQYPEVLVFYTGNDPGVRGYGWAMSRVGDLMGSGRWPPGENTNNYFCVSLCAGDRRQAVFWKSLHVLAIDDVGTKVPEQILLDRFGVPGWAWETSPGNQQWFYRLVPPVQDRDVALQLVHLLRNDAKDIVKLMRLPVGKNNKAKYGLGDAGFKTRLISSANSHSPHGQLEASEVLASWDADSVPEELKPPKVVLGSGLLSTKPGKSVLELIGEDPVGKCLLALGRVKHMIPSRLGIEIVCPWEHEHTVRTETGSAYFPETGGFECHHGHCQDRTGRELRAALEEEIAKSGLWEGGVLGVAGRGFDPVQAVDSDDADRPYREVFLDRYIYIKSERKFLDTKSRNLLQILTIDDVERQPMLPWLRIEPPAGAPVSKAAPRFLSPSAWFHRNAGRVADKLTSWPGREEYFADARGDVLANLWRPVPRPLKGRKITEQEVKRWIELISEICRNEGPEVAGLLIDWFAMLVGAPEIKPGWHPIVISEIHGIGKNLLLQPVLRVLQGYATTISAEDLKGIFNEHFTKRLVSINDIDRNTRGTPTAHDAYEKLKPFTENATEEITINPKFDRKFVGRNTAGVYITGNHAEALPLSEHDRRFLGIVSTMKPHSKQHYTELARHLGEISDEIGEYLHLRWEEMPQARRDALVSRAPMTPGKRLMIRLGEDPLTSWLRQQIEDGIWQDLMTTRDIEAALQEAARYRVLRYVPSRQRWISALHKIGPQLWNSGRRVVMGNQRIRMWMVRNVVLYKTMGPDDITNAYAGLRSIFS